MTDISEIQDMVLYSLKATAQTIPNRTLTLWDSFVSRQYIVIYPPTLIRFALGDIGQKFLDFVSLIDVEHPDLPFACGGSFNLESGFSKLVDEILTVAKVEQSQNLGLKLSLPALVDTLKKRHREPLAYIKDMERYIRFLENPKGRDNVRTVLARNFTLNIAKPRIWQKLPKTFKTYARQVGDPGDYYGFRRISMTNAAIILAKANSFAVRSAKVFSIASQVSSLMPRKIRDVIYLLDSFPDASHKPIFDRFWVVDSSGSSFVLLGERDKKCYFIICW